jgi:hypothetical protein
LVARFFYFILQYIDAAPLESVFDNVDVPQPIDRNGLLCNNIFEFAPNVFTIYTTRELSIWKKDMLHKNHWDVCSIKGKKLIEVDYKGRKIWPDGPKNKKSY